MTCLRLVCVNCDGLAASANKGSNVLNTLIDNLHNYINLPAACTIMISFEHIYEPPNLESPAWVSIFHDNILIYTADHRRPS